MLDDVFRLERRSFAVGGPPHHRERRHDAHGIAKFESRDALTYGLDTPGSFEPETRRQRRRLDVYPFAQQRFRPIEPELSFNDRFVDLAEGDYDLAIRTGDLEDRAGVIARRVARQKMVVCAAPSYLKAHGTPHSTEAVSHHQAVVYRRSGRVRPWLFPCDDGTTEEIMPANRVRLDDLDAIADAAAEGMGLAWVPAWLVRERIRAGELVQLLPERRDYLYDAYALWQQTPQLPLRVRLAIDALVVRLPDRMG